VRGLSRDEHDALLFVAGAPSTLDARTPEGARIDAAMHALIDRGCVTWKRYEGGTSFGITSLGRLAIRVAAAAGAP
jgi:hypothetical protein